jgi:hypothetical protein
MNPLGIPYFYASDSENTALAEMEEPGRYALARFETERPCRIVDLQRVREVPSIFVAMEEFDCQVFQENQDLSVLRWFAHAIAQPVKGDGKRETDLHVDYVPTQVSAEFFRTCEYFERPLEGIRFLSARDPNGSNLVLFADRRLSTELR